jgi:hypothetical protein
VNPSAADIVSEAAWDNVVAQPEAIVGRRLVDPSVGLTKRLIECQLICIGMNLLIGIGENVLGVMRDLERKG